MLRWLPSGGSELLRSRQYNRIPFPGALQLVLPFWSGATWDKQHGVDVERKR